jgi:hypothetical protein
MSKLDENAMWKSKDIKRLLDELVTLRKRIYELTHWQPDWTQAPPWAKYAAVDFAGLLIWFECAQTVERVQFRGHLDWSYGCRWEPGDVVDLPLGVDWRTTLRERPNEWVNRP